MITREQIKESYLFALKAGLSPMWELRHFAYAHFPKEILQTYAAGFALGRQMSREIDALAEDYAKK